MSFSRALIEAARRDLGSSSDYGVPGVFCAAAVRAWVNEAAQAEGVKAPPTSNGAKDTMARLDAAGLWLGKVAPQPGMIAVWHRGPENAPTGHIGIVEEATGRDGKFGTIEANAEAGVVARYRRDPNAAALIGLGGVGFVRPAPVAAMAIGALALGGLLLAVMVKR